MKPVEQHDPDTGELLFVWRYYKALRRKEIPPTCQPTIKPPAEHVFRGESRRSEGDASMRFKDYIWPHNPNVYEFNSYEFSFQRGVRAHRAMRGEGTFAGTDAYTEFKKLATVFYDISPGVLVNPLWGTTTAYFVSLTLRQEPAEDFVAYSFEFWECFTGECEQ